MQRCSAAPKAAPARPSPQRVPTARPAPAPRERVTGARDSGDLTGPQRRILDGLAWLEAAGITPANRPQTAFAAGYSPTSSAFLNPCSALRTAGLLEYPADGMIGLTEAGRAKTSASAPATAQDFQQRVLERLPGPQRKILRTAIAAYPADMSREELAEAAGYSPTSSAFLNPLSNLRSLRLVDYPIPGRVVALPALFLE
jgi:uncharacterized protein